MRNNKKESPLNVLDGGLAVFRGVELNGGKNKGTVSAEITDDFHITVISAFVDGNVHEFECDFEYTDNDNGVILSSVREFWNGEPLIGGD